jgi:hypothetical protein
VSASTAWRRFGMDRPYFGGSGPDTPRANGFGSAGGVRRCIRNSLPVACTRSSPRVGLGTFDKAVTCRAAEESIDRIGETEKGRPYSIRGRPKLASGAFCLPANGALSPMPAWRKAPRVGKGRYSSLATSRTYTLPPLEQNGPDASIGMSRPWADHECGDRLDL